MRRAHTPAPAQRADFYVRLLAVRGPPRHRLSHAAAACAAANLVAAVAPAELATPPNVGAAAPPVAAISPMAAMGNAIFLSFEPITDDTL